MFGNQSDFSVDGQNRHNAFRTAPATWMKIGRMMAKKRITKGDNRRGA